MSKQSSATSIPIAFSLDDDVYHAAVASPNPNQLPTHTLVESKPNQFQWVRHGLKNLLRSTGLIFLYLFAMLFDIIAFALLLIGIVFGLASLPVACIGIVLLMGFFKLHRPLARLDEYLFEQRKKLYRAIASTSTS